MRGKNGKKQLHGRIELASKYASTPCYYLLFNIADRIIFQNGRSTEIISVIMLKNKSE